MSSLSSSSSLPPTSQLQWRTLNAPLSSPTQDLHTPFTLTASPGTDLWRSNEHTNRHNAPGYITSVKTSDFRALRATISLKAPSSETTTPFWSQLYDQAGILMYWPSPSDGSMPKWIKAGVEFVDGKARVSVVACDRYSDWSLHREVGVSAQEPDVKVKIEAVREGDALWIVVDGTKIREPKFAFVGTQDDELWVGVVVARPGKEGGVLSVQFQEVDIEASK